MSFHIDPLSPGSGPSRRAAQIASYIARAVAAWPTFTVERRQFSRALIERLGDAATDEEIDKALAALHVEDLYLSCGCAAGDAAALAGFEQHCAAAITRAIATSGVPLADREDLEQIVRQRLLVRSSDGGPPRISTYSARGPLPAWVRVVATREAARVRARPQRERAEEDDQLASAFATEDAPELGYFKRMYGVEIKRAVHAAIEALSDRDRLLLCQHVLDGLSIDQLAALHAVHRATTARWLQGARLAVLEGTKRVLSERLPLSTSELASACRMIGRDLDVSLTRALRPQVALTLT